MTGPGDEPGWPAAWQVLDVAQVAQLVRCWAATGQHPVKLIAVDGHSASGKTTVAGRLVGALPRAAVLHSDDIAWHHSLFDWRELLVDGVLTPLRTGRGVDYRPPPWIERGRQGSITVPQGTEFLVLEGVGASRADLTDLLDAVIWVETDEPERLRRDDERVATGETTREIVDGWMSVENPFIAADRPWTRADLIVAGNSPLPHDRETQLVVSVRHPAPAEPRRDGSRLSTAQPPPAPREGNR